MQKTTSNYGTQERSKEGRKEGRKKERKRLNEGWKVGDEGEDGRKRCTDRTGNVYDLFQVQQWGHGVMASELPGTRYQASFTEKYSTPRTDDLYDLFPLQFMT